MHSFGGKTSKKETTCDINAYIERNIEVDCTAMGRESID
jgi:hypothetical protein